MSTASPRILIADDNAASRYVVGRWLRQAGFEIIEAGTGSDALARARDQPQLVVVDARLPDMSGVDVCRRIKADAATALIPVLHLAEPASPHEERVTALDGGADAYLAQPVEPMELLATVRALLRIRRAESALRASEERYRLVAQATNDIIWDWDLVENRILWNDALRGVLRIAADDVRAAPQWWWERIHPEDRARVVAGLHGVIDGGVEHWASEYRVLRGDGDYAIVYDRAYVAHSDDGRPTRMLGSMIDVTERRRREERERFLAEAGAVLASSLDYETTLKSVARLVVPQLADWCVVYVLDETDGPRGSPAIRRLATAASDPEKEALLREVERHVPGKGDGTARAAAAVMESGAPAFIPDLFAAHAPDGAHDTELLSMLRALNMRSTMVVPLLARGRALGALLLSTGERGWRYTTEDLALVQELAYRAGQAMDNARLYENSLLANRAKSDFLAVMSHELRTPLNAVVGYADLLAFGVEGQLTERGTQYVDRVKQCALHLLSLIEQILVYSRMETGRERSQPESVDVSAVIDDTTRLMEPLAAEKGLVFLRQLPPGPLVAQTDPGKLRQIVVNLLSNAVKFTPEGMIRVRAGREDSMLRIEVSDTGIGIAPPHLERIFDPFWQVEQQKTRREGGTGLGLTVTRRLVRILGGEIRVESEPAHGSKFTVLLPIRPSSFRPVEPVAARSMSEDLRDFARGVERRSGEGRRASDVREAGVRGQA
ncbi:MAG: response regulator [Gemmatimonadaceae bacterium]|nr:response regulator [Gemmatimonadaceae bacterium]NUR20724.1 response regulator [Gemmatimonadaceae bacterium]